MKPERNCEFLRLINANATTLRVLTVTPPQVGHLPIQMLGQLRVLSILGGKLDRGHKLIGFEHIFHHLVWLEALVLDGYLDASIFTSLQRNASMLPKLTSFRICYIGDYKEEHWDIVTEFIRGRMLLQRLDVYLGRSPWTSINDFLSVIRALPSLRVLGLYTGVTPLASHNISRLADNLPDQLEVLRLEIHWNEVIMRTYNLEPLVSFLSVYLLYLLSILIPLHNNSS
jgi:hypothetical protein